MNFRELLHYGGQPSVEYRRNTHWPCSGYCVSCEGAGLLRQIGGHLKYMSHGCDSEDFTRVLRTELPCNDGHDVIAQPVLFLLNEPSDKNYGVSKPIPFGTFNKQPPVWHYYWTPDGRDGRGWPTRIDEFDGNFYGPYFAYLMRRHQLRNVYITNLMKCKWGKEENDRGGTGDKSLLVRHCAKRYLTREVRCFEPRIVFCFGKVAETGWATLTNEAGRVCPFKYLYHPSYIKDRSQTSGRTPQELIQQNDDWVAQTLAGAGLFGADPQTPSARPRDAFPPSGPHPPQPGTETSGDTRGSIPSTHASLANPPQGEQDRNQNRFQRASKRKDAWGDVLAALDVIPHGTRLESEPFTMPALASWLGWSEERLRRICTQFGKSHRDGSPGHTTVPLGSGRYIIRALPRR